MPKKNNVIAAYIEQFPLPIQSKLQEMYELIARVAPQTEEKLAYGMPTFTLQGKNLVHFAAAKKHVGFYPAPSGIRAFESELAAYVTSKGAVQFPYTAKLPRTLLAKIVRFRIAEEQARAKQISKK